MIPEKSYTYSVESYALILNLDKSVSRLNPVLSPYGYEFIRVPLNELEKNFSDFFGLSPTYKSESYYSIFHSDGRPQKPGTSLMASIQEERKERLATGIPLADMETTLSEEFHDILMHSLHNGFQLLRDKEMIFLKRVEDYEREVINGFVTFESSSKAHNEMDRFVRNLVQHLRLLKNGDVIYNAQFHIAKEDRKVLQRFKPAVTSGTMIKLVIEENDVEEFKKKFSDHFSINTLPELALSTFNLAYGIPDMQSKFLNYMICLESIFNLGSDQISHTVSRHLAIILSSNREEFEAYYKRIKKLYNFRSKIVHGKKLDENIVSITEEMQNLVRKAINYCQTVDMSKEEFFNYLNAKGF